jgi:hypothetical protein
MPTTDYRRLQAEKIVQTIDLLRRRIQERFPDSSLHGVAGELHRISQEAIVRARAIRRPNFWLRAGVVLLVAVLVGFGSQLYRFVRVNDEVLELEHLVQSLEAAISATVFLGAAIFFVFSLELRLKRKRAFDAVRELRSLAHIIDMHQLTKDPERVTGRGPLTASSPKRSMTPFELGRYLDYCSEMLSLVSKTGALYVQEFPDPPTVEAFDRMTNLTTDLSRNVWQKIMILESTVEPEAKGSDGRTANSADGGSLSGKVLSGRAVSDGATNDDAEVTPAPPNAKSQID